MRISPGLTPPNGWSYLQGIFRIKGESFDNLVENVTAHRRSNGIPIGDVIGDIENQIAEAHPQLVIG